MLEKTKSCKEKLKFVNILYISKSSRVKPKAVEKNQNRRKKLKVVEKRSSVTDAYINYLPGENIESVI